MFVFLIDFKLVQSNLLNSLVQKGSGSNVSAH